MQRIWAALLITLAISPLAGCSSSDPLNRQAVSGKVTLDGVPLEQATIEFAPLDKGVSSGAQIKQGEFSIPAEQGLPPGEYRVRISASDETAEMVEAPGESNKIAKELIPAKYNAESDLTFTVKSGEENVFAQELKSGS